MDYSYRKFYMEKTLEALYLSGLQFLSPLTPAETYAKIVEEAKKIVGASYGTILLRERNTFVRVYTTIPIQLRTTSRKNGFSYTSFSSGEPLVVDAKDVLPSHPELKKIRLKKSVMVPLSYLHHAVGVLTLAVTKSQKISVEKLQMLKLFGAIASLSIRKTQLYKEAKDALSARDLFISMAAHELRTPLTAMTIYAHLLQKRFGNSDTSEAQWIEGLVQETKLLTRLISELFHVDSLRSGRFKVEKHVIDIHDVLKRAMKQFRIAYPFHTLLVKNTVAEGQGIIEADPDRILQVIQNILENAAKFSPVEKEIILTVKYKKPLISIKISDKGSGISKKELQMLPAMFVKGEKNYHDGMGLGLYLSKIILQEHHGSLEIVSNKRTGTDVVITLPLLKS